MTSRFAAMVPLLFLACCQEIRSQSTADPDAVVATVNGEKMTARQYNSLLSRADPATKALAQKQPEEFLRQLAFLQLVAEEAEKAKLDQMSPYRERLAESRRQILFQAAIDEKSRAVAPSEEQVKTVFDERQAGTAEARVKVIFISLVSQTRELAGDTVVATTTPEQAREKAASVAKRARSGEDFVTLAKEVSDDVATAEKGADFPEPVRPTSANIPTNIKEPILAAKQGEIVGPLPHETGFYIFQIQSTGVPEFANAKDEIAKELTSTALKAWVEQMRNEAKVTISHPSLLKPK